MAKIHEIDGWIDRVKEEIIDPQREIIDPHHHLWHGPENPPGIKESYKYLLEDLWNDTCSCLLYTSPSPRDGLLSRMPSSA